ncbi:MAG: AAA family ATPase [Phycisphaerales bacterium]|nr:AAA family ATPase [Phycisphaerales bacterium]
MSQAVSAHNPNPPHDQSSAGGDDQASRLRELVNSLGQSSSVEDPQSKADHTLRPPVRRVPVIAIASGKGGVGKTTTSVNLSIALAKHNRRAVLLDADLGLANADVLCGLMPKARLESAVGDGAAFSLEDLAIDAPGGFRLIPGSVGIGRVGELDEAERSILLSRLDDLHEYNDVIMIDTSAGLGPSVTAFIDAADACLMVVTPEPTSIADAYALIKVLVSQSAERPEARLPTLALIVNQAVNEKEANAVHTRISGVCDRFLGYQLPMIGYVRRDKKVVKAIKARTPYMIDAPKSSAARDMAELASSLIDWLGIEGRASAAPRRRFFSRL